MTDTSHQAADVHTSNTAHQSLRVHHVHSVYGYVCTTRHPRCGRNAYKKVPPHLSEGPGSSVTRLANPNKHWVSLMLDQRRRRWANIKPALGQCLVFDGS